MANEVALGGLTGGLQMGTGAGLLGAGLATAGLVSNPVGWGILAAGAIAGIASGSFAGSKAKKSKKYAAKAAAIQQERERNATEGQFLQMIRQGRVARASSSASATYSGIATSSLSTSALSSVGSQLGYNIQYLGEDRRLYSLYSKYMAKAGKAAQGYQTLLSLQNAASGLMMSAGGTLLKNKKDGITPWDPNGTDVAGVEQDTFYQGSPLLLGGEQII